MKYLLTIVLLIGFGKFASAQSSNFLAQGYYYKAKELFEKNNYKEAIKYINNSKASLQGTNYQLQYLHIQALVKLSDYTSAKIEMEQYFKIIEDNSLAKGFTKYVERLTDDETKALSKIMIDIMEKATIEDKNIPVKKINLLLAKTNGKKVKGEPISYSSGFINKSEFVVRGENVIFTITSSTSPTLLKRNYPSSYRVEKKTTTFKKADLLLRFNPQNQLILDGIIPVHIELKKGILESAFWFKAYNGEDILVKDSNSGKYATTEFELWIYQSDLNELEILLNEIKHN